MNVKQTATNLLIPYAKNARTHSDAQVQQLAGSIKEFGFCNPVLIDSENVIIAGHGRVLAAGLLGLDEIPTITLDHLSDIQKQDYIIADNKLALNAGWDVEMLALEMQAMESVGFDLELTGFDEIDVENFLNQDGEGTDPEEEWNGMPECDNDDISAWRQVIVSFSCQDDIDKFAKLIGQKFTDKTNATWFPKVADEKAYDKSYE